MVISTSVNKPETNKSRSVSTPANNKSKTVPSNPQIKNKPESSNANSKAANKSKPVAVPSKPTLSYEEMLRLADENQTKKLSFKPPQTNKTEEKKQVAASKPNSSATFYRAFKHSNSLNKPSMDQQPIRPSTSASSLNKKPQTKENSSNLSA